MTAETVSKSQPGTTIPGIEGQLNGRERELLTKAITSAPKPPKVAIEVGTWLGGGSTLHILRAMEQNKAGHLWGIEADQGIYDRMLANLRAAVPEALGRFTPVFGFSQDVIPRWLNTDAQGLDVDFAFLDGGNNPQEQITEFNLLASRIPVGGQLMAHDAKLRKGKWLVPYILRLDNWKAQLHDISSEGLLHAVKTAPAPSPESLRRARQHLLQMRFSPVEIAAAILPSSVCAFVLGLMPKSASRRLADGRK